VPTLQHFVYDFENSHLLVLERAFPGTPANQIFPYCIMMISKEGEKGRKGELNRIMSLSTRRLWMTEAKGLIRNEYLFNKNLKEKKNLN